MKALTLLQAAAALRSGTVSSVSLLEQSFAAADIWDSRLGIYLTRTDELALAAAQRADDELAAGRDRGPLHGIPFGVKDLIAVAGLPTTAQSLVQHRFRHPNHDAPVVARLRAAGAVLTGKTSTMEFGCGTPDPEKPFPIPLNPWDRTCWAGGSSSGTASGIATATVLSGLGTDTAGSIRMPAAFCGVTGLAPSFGLLPASGCIPLAPSLDRVGPLAHGARDCAAVLTALTGQSAGANDPFALPAYGAGLSGLRIGLVREHHFPSGADPALRGVFDDAVSVFSSLGAYLAEVSLPLWNEAITATMVTVSVEGLAHHHAQLSTQWQAYTRSARGLLALGALISEADYLQAQRVRMAVQELTDQLFETVDVIVCPTAAISAPTSTELTDESGLQDPKVFAKIFTPYWSATANPVLSMPIGRNAAGLPLAAQVAGPRMGDAVTLRVAAAFQDHTTWHEPRTPPVASVISAPGAGE